MIQKSCVCLGRRIKNGLSVVCLLILGGCGGGVREDRTIEFSADGARVAFQHGQDGIYVANSNGVGLTLAIGMSLAPLFRADFFEQLPREIAQETIEKWSELLPDNHSGLPAIAINLVLRAAANRLGNTETRKLAEERLAVNTDAQPLFTGKSIDDAIESWFQGVEGK